MQPKRSTSPTNPPARLTELLREFKDLRQDFGRQESSIREIRSIGLENQHILRTRLRSMAASLKDLVHEKTSPTVSGTNNNTRSSTIQSHTNNGRVSRPKLTNASVKDSAQPIPKPTKPIAAAVPKICWYHRQFGQASTNCIQPCSFEAPPTVGAVNQPLSQILTRVPLERTINNVRPTKGILTDRISIISIKETGNQSKPPEKPAEQSATYETQSSNMVISPTPANDQHQQPADWNTLQELYEQSFPSLSDESDSSSSSDSEDSQDETEDGNKNCVKQGEETK